MSPRSRTALLVLFALAVLVRVVHLSELPSDPLFRAPTLDALYHQHHARGLARGDWTLPPGVPAPAVRTTALHRPLGYPLFLAALYRVVDSPWTPRAAQLVLGLLAGWLAFLLTRRLRPDDALAPLVAAACVWLSPLALLFETELQAATLTGVLLLLLTLAALRMHEGGGLRSAAVFGVVLGIAMLVRPNLAPLGLLVLPAALREARQSTRARGALLVVVPALLTVALAAAVPLRNLRATGEPILTPTNGALALVFANHPGADGVENVPPPGDTFRGVHALSPFGFPRFKRTVERNLARGPDNPLSTSELVRVCTRAAGAFVRTNPGRFASLTLRRAALLLGPRSVGNNREVAVLMGERAALRFAPARFALLCALAFVGAATLLARRREEDARRGLFLVASGALYLLPLVFFFAGSRFRAPLVPVFAVLAGIGVSALIAARHEPTRRRAVAVGLALGCATWLAAPLAPPARPARHLVQRAVAWQMLGDETRATVELTRARELGGADRDTAITLGYLALGAGRHAEAEAAFRDALRAGAEVAALAGLGAALVGSGRAADAVAALSEAVALDPEHETALYNLGLARFAARDAAGAADAYQQLLRAHPKHHAGRTNLARTYLALGQPERALPLLDEVLAATPDDWGAALNRAIALERSGRIPDAIAAYRALLDTRADDTDALTNLGVLLMRTDARAAITPLRRAAELRPEHAGIQLNLVTAHLNAGAFSAARTAFERALTSVSPGDVAQLRAAERRFCSPDAPATGFCPAP